MFEQVLLRSRIKILYGLFTLIAAFYVYKACPTLREQDVCYTINSCIHWLITNINRRGPIEVSSINMYLKGIFFLSYLTMHSTHFTACYTVSNMWLRTTQIMRGNPLLSPKGYFFQLAAIELLDAPFQRQDSTYHSLCYTSHGALAGTRNSSMGPPLRIDLTIHCTLSECSYHGAKSRSEKKMYYLTMHSTHFAACYTVSDMRLRTTQIMRVNPLLSLTGYLF